jgi:hypothetical protein
MKFFVNQKVMWQDKSQSRRVFDINSESEITVATVKSSSRPKYELRQEEALIETVKVDGVAQASDGFLIEMGSKIEYFAKIANT